MLKANELLKGFRTVLLAIFLYALMFIEHLANALTGISVEALKGAAIIAIPIIIKQIVTDVVPKLRGKLQK